MKKLCRKQRRKKGFTMAETLLAVLILLLAAVIVSEGIPAAKKAYEDIVLASNAEVLLSTTVSTLRNELGTATVISYDDTSITYFNAARGAESRIYLSDEEPETIFISPYSDYADVDAYRLISQKTSTADLYVTYEKISVTEGIITFENLRVDRASGTVGLATRPTFSIRTLFN